MKKKSTLPISRGEFRAIAVTSLVICLSVILPPHLVPLLQPVKQPIVEITDLESENTNGQRSAFYSSSQANSGREKSDAKFTDINKIKQSHSGQKAGGRYANSYGQNAGGSYTNSYGQKTDRSYSGTVGQNADGSYSGNAGQQDDGWDADHSNRASKSTGGMHSQ